MNIGRRDFLRYCGIAAAGIGLSAVDLGLIEKALANPQGPSVIWLQGSACSGCSVSFLNRVATTAPISAGDVLISSINLVYHPELMAPAGESAAALAEEVYTNGGYVLAVEGGVPTAFGGHTCMAWTFNGVEEPFKDVVVRYAARASKVICVGTCASYGGVAAAPPNPTGVRSVKAITGASTINIAGCPPHPDWLVWTIAQLIASKPISLDSYGRPTAFYTSVECNNCRRRGTEEAETYGVDNHCLREVGCKGPHTHSDCPKRFWNNAMNVCQEANAPCIGCTEPDFATKKFYGEDDD